MFAQKRDWRGSFAIPMTPWDDSDRIDEDVLRAEIEFIVAAGAGGIVAPVMVSEFFVLSEDERRLMIRLPVEVVKGRLPVVANVAAANTPLAARYAAYAQEAGADAVIAMPPYIQRADFQAVYAYYQAISEAVSVPIWIQNASIAPLSIDQVITLCSEIEHVSWVKEEVEPSPRHIGELVNRKAPAVKGVMGGAGGRYLIDEWQRGARGCIHACQFCDVLQHVWDHLEAGRLEAAGDLFEHLLPSLVLEGVLGMAYAKEIMLRRGVFKNTRMRLQTNPLSADDKMEIDRTWERIQPYLTWK